uniref:Calcitonin peptide-like domain-containing protein n=1 Tax=Scleropages formosus TaxID=113540 RepID=A0A8C9WJG6_SCLFO
MITAAPSVVGTSLHLDMILDRPMAKRCSNLSTCVLGKLSQELHKLQTYPRTDVGAGTPGKKRSLPEGGHPASYWETLDGN